MGWQQLMLCEIKNIADETRCFILPLFTMSSLVLTILMGFGLLRSFRGIIKCTKTTILFFLVSVSVLYGFNLRFNPEFVLNMAVIPVFVSAWILYAKRDGKIPGKLFLFSMISGMAMAIPSYFFGNSEWLLCIFALIPSVVMLLFGDALAGICSAASIPIFIELNRFVLELLLSGYAFVQFGSSVADVQLMGMLLIALITEFTFVRNKNKLENKRI